MRQAGTPSRRLPATSANETDFGFRRVPEAAKAPLVRAVFDSVAERYDLMNDLMSAGIHRLWKDEMVAWLNPRPGQRMLDVAGGTGDIARRALPRASQPASGGGVQVVVCDANPRMLEIGRARAIDDGILVGIEFVCGECRGAPVRRPVVRPLYDRLRAAQRHPDRARAGRGTARAAARRAFPVPGIHPRGRAGPAAALRGSTASPSCRCSAAW